MSATSAVQRVLLVGGGHAHLEVLRRFARRRDDRVALTVVSPESTMCYSGDARSLPIDAGS